MCFKPHTLTTFYFYENSAVRMAGLKAVEQLLQTKELKLKKSYAGCQLIMPVTALESEAEERGS